MADQSTPVKGAAYDLYFTLYKNDGTVIANPGTYTKKISKDGGAVGDCANSVTEIDTTYGECKLTLSAAEMTADAVWVQIKDDTTGCVPFTATLYPCAALQTGDTFAIVKAGGTGDNAAVKAKTDNLPASPAAVGSAMTLTSAYDHAKDNVVSLIGTPSVSLAADLASLFTYMGALQMPETDVMAVIRSIAAKTKNLPAVPAAKGDIPSQVSAASVADAVWDETIADHTGAGQAGKAVSDAGALGSPLDAEGVREAIGLAAANLDTQLAGISAAGSGSISWAYTLTESDAVTPIPDADVWITLDQAGGNIVASGKTDTFGNIVFMLDAGTYYIWAQKTGWNFTNPDVEVVS